MAESTQNNRFKRRLTPRTEPRTILPLPSQLLPNQISHQFGNFYGTGADFLGRTGTSESSSIETELGAVWTGGIDQTLAVEAISNQQYPAQGYDPISQHRTIPTASNRFGTSAYGMTTNNEEWLLDDALLRQPSGSSIIESDSILERETGRTYSRAGYIVPNDPVCQKAIYRSRR